MGHAPSATSRLQLEPDFDLDAAAAVVPYLAALGAGALYRSPIFEARRGSRHGYDVTDPEAVRTALGGEAALRRLVEGREGAAFRAGFVPFARRIAYLGALNSLAGVVLRCASRGYPTSTAARRCGT